MGTYRRAIGATDGVNRTFFTPTPYEPGETRFLLKGQMLSADCITEVNPATGEVRWEDAQPPRVGDDVLLYYFEAGASTVPPVELILPIKGVLVRCEELRGALQSERSVTGVLTRCGGLKGSVRRSQGLTGRIRRTRRLTGRLTREDC